MWTEHSTEVKIFMQTDNGLLEIPEIKNIEFTHSEEVHKASIFEPFREISFCVKIPKNLRCKSRKRFVKLLMSYGLSKNTANTLADISNLLGYSYQMKFNEMFWSGNLGLIKPQKESA